jgi:hypothetical protein
MIKLVQNIFVQWNVFSKELVIIQLFKKRSQEIHVVQLQSVGCSHSQWNIIRVMKSRTAQGTGLVGRIEVMTNAKNL